MTNDKPIESLIEQCKIVDHDVRGKDEARRMITLSRLALERALDRVDHSPHYSPDVTAEIVSELDVVSANVASIRQLLTQ